MLICISLDKGCEKCFKVGISQIALFANMKPLWPWNRLLQALQKSFKLEKAILSIKCFLADGFQA